MKLIISFVRKCQLQTLTATHLLLLLLKLMLLLLLLIPDDWLNAIPTIGATTPASSNWRTQIAASRHATGSRTNRVWLFQHVSFARLVLLDTQDGN